MVSRSMLPIVCSTFFISSSPPCYSFLSLMCSSTFCNPSSPSCASTFCISSLLPCASTFLSNALFLLTFSCFHVFFRFLSLHQFWCDHVLLHYSFGFPWWNNWKPKLQCQKLEIILICWISNCTINDTIYNMTWKHNQIQNISLCKNKSNMLKPNSLCPLYNKM